jgi:hypothetical protein
MYLIAIALFFVMILVVAAACGAGLALPDWTATSRRRDR